MVELSAEYLLSCADKCDGCDGTHFTCFTGTKKTNANAAAAGGYVDEAWRYLRDAGVDEEACSPYLQMEQAGVLN